MSKSERPYPPRMHEPKGAGHLYHLWRNKWRKIGHVSDLAAAYDRYRELEETIVEPDRREKRAQREQAKREKAANRTRPGRSKLAQDEAELLALYRRLAPPARRKMVEVAEILIRRQGEPGGAAPRNREAGGATPGGYYGGGTPAP